MTEHTHSWRTVPGGRPRTTPENEERDGQNPAGPTAKGAGPDDLAEGADEPKDPADERNDEDADHQWEDDGGAGHANGYSDLGMLRGVPKRRSPCRSS